MNLTPEQKQAFYAQMGKKPYEGNIDVDPNGDIYFTPTPTDDSGWWKTAGRNLLPELTSTAIGTVGGLATTALAAKKIAALSAMTGEFAPATGAVLGAGAFGLGAAGANALDDVGPGIGKKVRNFVGLTDAQRMRDETEHPMAVKAAQLAGMLGSSRLNSIKDFVNAAGGVRKLTSLSRTLGLAPAESEALKKIGSGVGLSVGMEGYHQAKDAIMNDGSFHPGALAEAALTGAAFGTPRIKGWMDDRKAAAMARATAAEAPKMTNEETRPIPVEDEMKHEPWKDNPPEDLSESVPGTFARQRPNFMAPATAADAQRIAGGKFNPNAPTTMAPATAADAGRGFPGWRPTTIGAIEPIGPRIPMEAGTPEAPFQGQWTPRRGLIPERVPMTPEEIRAANIKVQAEQEALIAQKNQELPIEDPEMRNEIAAKFNRGGGLVPLSDEQGGLYSPLRRARMARPGVQRELPIEPGLPPSENPPVDEQGMPLAFQQNVPPVNPPPKNPWTTVWGEKDRAKFQHSPKGVATDSAPVESAAVAGGREALKRRGFEFAETDAPLTDDAGAPISGAFDPASGRIVVSKPNVQDTTHRHEGGHAELQDMLGSENPHIRQLGQKMKSLTSEENLVELMAKSSAEESARNPLVRFLRDNWNYFRTTKFGGADQSPERMARILAERFDLTAPGKVKGLGEGDIKYERLSKEQEHVPMSVIAEAAKLSPETGKAASDFFSLQANLFGNHINAPLAKLAKFPQEIVQSAIWKRSKAGQTGAAPNFTPEEMVINGIYEKAMQSTLAQANAAGFPISKISNYVPEMLDATIAKQAGPNVDEFLAKRGQEFHDINSQIHGTSYDPVAGHQYIRDYLIGAAHAPNSSGGSDFGALTKNARRYHLPDAWREPDMLRNLERYGDRYSRQVAKRLTIEQSPEAALHLGFAEPAKGQQSSGLLQNPAMQNLRKAVQDTLFNEGRGTSGVGESAKELFTATQQFANSAAMQTATGLSNTLSKIPMHMVNARNPEEAVSMFESTLKTVNEYQSQLEKAIKANVVKPGRDPNVVNDEQIAGKLAQNIKFAATKMRIYTGADAIETMNRVHDYTIGEGLAEINLKLLATKDPQALEFVKRFGAGVDDTMSHDQQIAMMARNYAISIQSSYSAEGLPAPMLKGGIVGHATRIQRFGFENMNRVRQQVIEPARKGNYLPLLTYVAGTALAAPALVKMREFMSGRPSGLPTDEEIAISKKDPTMEHVLNIMSLAQVTGAFGTIGQVAGTVSSNARGNPQALVSDPIIGLGTGILVNMAGAYDAIKDGEPVVPVLEEAFKRAILERSQMFRGLTTDRGEAEDRRNKHLYEYLMETRDIPMDRKMLGAVGLAPTYTPEISPNKEAAREGNLEARQQVDRKQRSSLNNYPGGYEDPMKESKYRRFLRDSKGPEALDAYLGRRRAFRMKAAGQPQE